MNDEQMQPLLDRWFSDREVAPRDVREGVARVMASVPQTRQQGRWWPLPVLHRKVQSPTATEMTEYQPSPILATNGHGPTVIGRTRLMLSPVKTITAGALVFALGSAFLIAQPFGQQDVAVPGAETPELSGVTVTVTQQCVDFDPCIWTASDPRLPDTIAIDMFTGFVDVVGDDDAGFAWLEQSSEGPEGGWTGYVYALWGEPTQNFLVLSGTGANEGWQYIASGTDPDTDGDFEWTGTLYQGGLPPFPEAPTE
jgi:hypothetical protein